MQFGKPNAFFIGTFEIQVHHLLGNGLSLGRDALIKKQLVLNLRHRRSFDGRRVGDDRIQIELLIVYL